MNKYNITEDELRSIIEDITYLETTDRHFSIMVYGYEDEDGNIRCSFLEEFDKAMKEEALKYDI